MSTQRRALFVSHGGGPLPLLGDAGHAEMRTCLQDIAASMERPSAIVVVSAHWEADCAQVTTTKQPSLIYDYSGFPPASYEITYPCPGHPSLAQDVLTQLTAAGLTARPDHTRGFDHGLFVPLKIMYPAADIPCMQLSLVQNLDPAAHLEIGRALQGVLDSSVLLIGSGFSFHNMQAFFSADTPDSRNANAAFEAWLQETCASTELDEAERAQRLLDWTRAPAARYCHPREEHLLPLHVCYGYAAAPCAQAFALRILHKDASMFVWQ